MAVGQVEDGLLGQLLGVIGPRSAHQDDQAVRADDMEVADPPAGPRSIWPSICDGQFGLALDPIRDRLESDPASCVVMPGLPVDRRG